MYEKLLSTTQPGTEIKVTPESDALIIPKATMYHGDFLFPRKNASLLAFLLVKKEMKIKTRKYATIMNKIKKGDIKNKFVKTKCKDTKNNSNKKLLIVLFDINFELYKCKK